MTIDFTLSSAQRRLQQNAREFALEILQPVVRAADEEPDTQKAFVMLKGAYVEAYKQAADKLLKEGFLRPADHAPLLEQAKAVKLSK